MNSINNNATINTELPLLTERQEMVTQLLVAATDKIVKNISGEIFKIFQSIQADPSNPKAIIDAKVQALVDPLSSIDDRISKVLQKIMVPVDQIMNEVLPNSSLKHPFIDQSFSMLSRFSGDVQIRKKICEGVALPIVKNLIQDFDNVSVSIVNDIINTDSNNG